jgi:iron(II)-dependent oxidoreductase
MSKKLLIILIIILSLPNLYACNSISSNPEEALWGIWEYDSNQNGNDDYFYDLEFLRDGSLILNGRTDILQFVVISPGRIKFSNDEQSEVISYEITENTLALSFGSGTNYYQLKTQSTQVAQVNTSPVIIVSPSPTSEVATPIASTATTIPSSQTPAIETPTNEPPTIEPTAFEPTTSQTMSAGSNFTRDSDGMMMMYVPEGSFFMGSSNYDSNAYAHEKPRHEVYLDAFWMDAYEVSNAMFNNFIETTGYRTLAEEQGYSYMYNALGDWESYAGVNWRHPLGAVTTYQDSMPVTHVNRYDAQAYCQWVGGRLPTEAEWEKAARGEDERIYPWGNSYDSSLAHNNHTDGPSSVYSYSGGVSPFGIYNLAGNVFEWTIDWYDANYYSNSPYDNPLGPIDGEWGVVRGGGWKSSNKHIRTAHRDISMPDQMNYLLGFRCVMDP